MRVLVTGAAGQLGQEVVAAFAAHDVVGVDRTALDIGDRDATLAGCVEIGPDLIVNCAAFTAVDACETDPDTAWRVNALGPRHVVEGARLVDAHIVQVSTDYVFDGEAAQPYTEWDHPNPQSVYGRSKLGGEREMRATDTIVRSSWMFSPHPPNILTKILELASDDGRVLTFVDDQRGTPTAAIDVAGAIRTLGVARRPGIFHVVNRGETTWYEFAREVLGAAGHDPARVKAVTTTQLDPPRVAPRPPDSRLADTIGVGPLTDWRDAVHRAVAALG